MSARFLMRFWMVLLTVFLVYSSALGQTDSTTNEPQKDAKALVDQAKNDVANLDSSILKAEQRVELLKSMLDREVGDRDKLLLQRRFFEGKEYFFMLGDYQKAAETFYGIVNYPNAATFLQYNESLFYLSESLFQRGYKRSALVYFDLLVRAGKSNPYYATSLLRCIEISVEKKDYQKAETYYSAVLSSFPEEEDGSMARYLIGKGLMARGDLGGGINMLNSIGDHQNYYATAQYYLGVMEVKQGKYKEASERFAKAKETLRYNMANKEKLHNMFNLALGRLYYELDRFPQAMASYITVLPESDEYSKALYESIWVFLTRNDYLIQTFNEEHSNYEDLNYEYIDLAEAIETHPDKEGMAPISNSLQDLQGELDDMQRIFDEIDEGMTHLQIEALDEYKKLQEVAPKSPMYADSELLIGDIYNQVKEFKSASNQFDTIRSKYGNYSAQVRQAIPSLSKQELLLYLDYANAPKGKPKPPINLKGMPEEVAFWLAADEELKKLYNEYSLSSEERKSIEEIRNLINEVQAALNQLSQTPSFPIIKEAEKRAEDIRSDVQSITDKINSIQTTVNSISTSDKGEISSKIDGFKPRLSTILNQINSLDQRMKTKKQEMMSKYRSEVAESIRPIGELERTAETLNQEAAGWTSDVAMQKMHQVQAKMDDMVLKAELGSVDSSWKASQGSNQEIKDIQKKMSDEIRQFKKLYDSTLEQKEQEDKTKKNKDDKSKDDKGGKKK